MTGFITTMMDIFKMASSKSEYLQILIAKIVFSLTNFNETTLFDQRFIALLLISKLYNYYGQNLHTDLDQVEFK